MSGGGVPYGILFHDFSQIILSSLFFNAPDTNTILNIIIKHIHKKFLQKVILNLLWTLIHINILMV